MTRMGRINGIVRLSGEGNFRKEDVMLRRILLAVACTFILGGTANSASIFFGEDLSPGGAVPAGGNAETARTNFLGNLVGVGTENFDGIASGTSANGMGLNYTGSSGGITATISNAGSAVVASSPDGFGRFATSGSNYLTNVTSGFQMDFSSEIAAFGFYGTDIGDFNGQITLWMNSGLAQSYTVNNTLNGPNAGLLFWGVIAGLNETFTRVIFGNTNAGTDVFGFDDLTIGDLAQVVPGGPAPISAIPLPPSAILFGTALLGLAGLRRRKRKAA